MFVKEIHKWPYRNDLSSFKDYKAGQLIKFDLHSLYGKKTEKLQLKLRSYSPLQLAWLSYNFHFIMTMLECYNMFLKAQLLKNATWALVKTITVTFYHLD